MGQIGMIMSKNEFFLQGSLKGGRNNDEMGLLEGGGKDE